MRFRIFSLIAAVALVAALVPAAHARPQGHALVVSGEANAYRDIRLSHAVKIRCCGYRADDARAGLDIVGFDAHIEGGYGGFLIERLRDGRVMVGAIRVPSMDLSDGDVPFFAQIGHDKKLSPDDYRVHLIGDGRTRVRVDLGGAVDDIRARTNHPSDVTAELFSWDGQMTHHSQPVPAGRRAAAIVAIQADVKTGQATYLSACLTQGEECVSADEDDRAEDLHVSVGSGRSGTAVTAYYARGDLPPEDLAARFTVGTVGSSTRAHGFYLILN